jgi:NAD(P)-dependent dehydrogenase (short-subunit alcohol dehydrogenase family)
MRLVNSNHENKVALVTGATGAIGRAIALQIAKDHSYSVVLVCRDEGKAVRTVNDIRLETGNDRVDFELVDLSREKLIKELANCWNGPLHVLINNAAVTPRKRLETPEGIELQFATNVLAYLWMVKYFNDILVESAPSRVVNVASYWAGDLDITDLEFKRRPYNNNRAYRQSKQANRMLTVGLSDRMAQQGVVVNTCHPGDVNSKLSNDLGFGGHETPEEGALTPVWLAIEAVGGEVTGKYFEHKRKVRCRFGEDRTAVEELYQACLGYSVR